jgi:hypothetical protein
MNNVDLSAIEDEALNGFKFTGSRGTLGAVISAALPYIFFFAGLLLLIYLIIGGYRLMFSQGDPKAIADGKTKVTQALIGFIIIFAAYWIVQLVGLVLGLNDITNTF